MRVQQLIVGRFKQAFHKMFAKQCRILHMSRIRKDGTKILVVPERPLSD